MTRNQRRLAGMLATVLALAVLIPGAAVGQQGTDTPRTVARTNRSLAASSTAGFTMRAARKAALAARIEATLKRHAVRFNRMSHRLTLRVKTVGTLADKVAAAGGDVGKARAALDSAKQHLSTASSLEAKAAEQFRAIPSATDRPAAFATARATVRSANAELVAARKDLRSAIRDLRTTIAGLKSSAGAD